MKKNIRIIFSLISILMLVFQLDASQNEEDGNIKSLLEVSSAFKSVAKRVNPSVVTIEITYKQRQYHGHSQFQPFLDKFLGKRFLLQKGQEQE